MRPTRSIALVAAGVVLLAGCASGQAELPGATDPTETDPPEATMEASLNPAECIPGAWRVDNAAQLENMQSYDPTLGAITGTATVTFGEQSLELAYDGWTLEAGDDDEKYLESRNGSNSGSYRLDGELLEPMFDDFGVQLTIEFDGQRDTDEEDVDGVELLGTVYCYADSLVIETDPTERTYLIPAN